MATRVSKRRAIADALISIASVLVLLLGIIAIDARVRERALLLLEGKQLSVELTAAGERIAEFSRIAAQVAHDQGMEHAPVVIFVAAAAVLTIFMLRT
jgi:hypothetical protein